MRVVIGWMAALFASALLGAVVYEAVLSKPLPEPDPTAYVEMTTRTPQPGPTVYRTEVRKVIEPTATITVIEDVVAPVAPAPAAAGGHTTTSPRATRDDASEKATTWTKEREDSEDESEEDESEEDESEEDEHDEWDERDERESDDD